MGDDEEWEELRDRKVEKLHSTLMTLDPLHCAEFPGKVHPEDEQELALFERQHRGVSAWRVATVLTHLCTFVDGLDDSDPPFKQSTDSQQSNMDLQLDQEMLDDPDRSETPQWLVSVNRRGEEREEESASLSRMKAPSGTYNSPQVPPSRDGEPHAKIKRRGYAHPPARTPKLRLTLHAMLHLLTRKGRAGRRSSPPPARRPWRASRM